MAGKNAEQKSWSNPNDYGLPFVEIKPLSDLGKTSVESEVNKVSESVEKPKSAAELRSEVQEKLTLAAKQKIHSEKVEKPKEVEEAEVKSEEIPVSPSMDDKKEEVAEEKAPVKPEKSPSNETKVIEKKKSNSWIAYAAIIALFLVATIVWQLMKDEPNSLGEPVTSELALAEKENNEIAQEEIKITPTEEIQVSENQDSISNSNTVSTPIQESTETGTTIDHSGERSLTRIEGKEARPQYFIVVGSLPNERLAIQESNQYYDRAEELFLILPYEDAPHYRLAIGKFTSFTKANAELAQIKDQYTEALWILKY